MFNKDESAADHLENAIKELREGIRSASYERCMDILDVMDTLISVIKIQEKYPQNMRNEIKNIGEAAIYAILKLDKI